MRSVSLGKEGSDRRIDDSPPSDPSSTVRKTEWLSLNDLRKAKLALALQSALGAVCYVSRKVGGKATPAARTAWEACPAS
jgi:hypothetical protein